MPGKARKTFTKTVP